MDYFVFVWRARARGKEKEINQRWLIINGYFNLNYFFYEWFFSVEKKSSVQINQEEEQQQPRKAPEGKTNGKLWSLQVKH